MWVKEPISFSLSPSLVLDVCLFRIICFRQIRVSGFRFTLFHFDSLHAASRITRIYVSFHKQGRKSISLQFPIFRSSKKRKIKENSFVFSPKKGCGFSFRQHNERLKIVNGSTFFLSRNIWNNPSWKVIAFWKEGKFNEMKWKLNMVKFSGNKSNDFYLTKRQKWRQNKKKNWRKDENEESFLQLRQRCVSGTKSNKRWWKICIKVALNFSSRWRQGYSAVKLGLPCARSSEVVERKSSSKRQGGLEAKVINLNK